jgi:hypothetical protein
MLVSYYRGQRSAGQACSHRSMAGERGCPWLGRRAQSLYCAIPATGRPTPSGGSLPSRRRNKAIAPYGPTATRSRCLRRGQGIVKDSSPWSTVGSIRRRQDPLYAFETREIAIEAEDCRAVLDSQRGKVRVRRQIATGARGLEQSPEYLRMPQPVRGDARANVRPQAVHRPRTAALERCRDECSSAGKQAAPSIQTRRHLDRRNPAARLSMPPHADRRIC